MLSLFPRDVLDEILDLIESVSEGFPSYSCISELLGLCCVKRIRFLSLEISIHWLSIPRISKSSRRLKYACKYVRIGIGSLSLNIFYCQINCT